MFSVSLFQLLLALTVTLNLTPRTRGSAATLFRRFETPLVLVVPTTTTNQSKNEKLLSNLSLALASFHAQSLNHIRRSFFFINRKNREALVLFFFNFLVSRIFEL